MARQQNWTLYQCDTADLVYSLKIGGPTGKKGRKNFHIGYLANQIVGRSLNITEVLSQILNSALEIIKTGAISYTLFRATVIEGEAATALLLGSAPDLSRIFFQGGRILENQICGLDKSGRLHLFPSPDRVLDKVRLVICSDPAVSEIRRLSPGELALQVISEISAAGFLPIEAMTRLANLSESVTGLECHPSQLVRLIQERCLEEQDTTYA